MFQFLKGSIQATIVRSTKIKLARCFNSLKVRFRPKTDKLIVESKESFNSLKVRFRQFFINVCLIFYHRFNSLKVRFRPGYSPSVTGAYSRFNSLKVRFRRKPCTMMMTSKKVFQFLKGSIQACVPLAGAGIFAGGFNSLKVRFRLVQKARRSWK